MKTIPLKLLTLPLLNATGQKVCLADFAGKFLVLYFYPKDDTPGCTTEACSFRDVNQAFEELGAVVIGISKDGQQAHQKFANKHLLNFQLLSDPELHLIKGFGLWQKKRFLGREYLGTLRSSFIIGRDGTILKEYHNVKPQGHGEQVLADLKKLVSNK